MRPEELELRAVAPADRAALRSFRCSHGAEWEDAVQHQVRGPLPNRYLSTPPHFDGRMLIGLDSSRQILVVGAHHIEPTLVPDVGYVEAIAVANAARGVLIDLPGGERVSLGHYMLLAMFKQMMRLGRHPRTFARIDRRNVRSLALLDRVGLTDERDDPADGLVQRWGTMPHVSPHR